MSISDLEYDSEEYIDYWDDEILYVASVTFSLEVISYYYDPGVTHLAPEDCYPPEGECEWGVIDLKLFPIELSEGEVAMTYDQAFDHICNSEYFDGEVVSHCEDYQPDEDGY